MFISLIVLSVKDVRTQSLSTVKEKLKLDCQLAEVAELVWGIVAVNVIVYIPIAEVKVTLFVYDFVDGLKVDQVGWLMDDPEKTYSWLYEYKKLQDAGVCSITNALVSFAP